jgi:hypothetical protein
MFRPVLTVAVLLLLAGCAASIGEGPLPASHPASPGGPEAPPALRSDTLSLGSGEAPAQPGAAADAAPHDHHGAPENANDAAAPQPAHDHAAHGHGEAGAATTKPSATYTCPHHPEVVSDQPGTCPKCKMTLEKKG